MSKVKKSKKTSLNKILIAVFIASVILFIGLGIYTSLHLERGYAYRMG